MAYLTRRRESDSPAIVIQPARNRGVGLAEWSGDVQSSTDCGMTGADLRETRHERGKAGMGGGRGGGGRVWGDRGGVRGFGEPPIANKGKQNETKRRKTKEMPRKG